MKILLIPSATLVADGQKNYIGKIPAALYPLEDVAMIEHLYKQYCNIVDAICVVVYQKKDAIKEYLSFKKLNVHLIELDEIRDLGYTIKFGIENIINTYGGEIETLYINFADTLISNSPCYNDDNIVYYQMKAISEEWSFFCENLGEFISITDKKDSFSLKGTIEKVFVGVFQIKIVTELFAELNKACEQINTMDSFYCALQEYSKKNPCKFLEAKDWFDVGHTENYFQAKTGVAARSFNTVTIDEKRGILKKSSENKEKLINEIKWYIKIPQNLQYLLPRIYSYSLDFFNPYISMEYYGYNTLHEVLLYGDMPKYKWKNIFEKLLFAIQDMEKYRVFDESYIREAMKDIYIKKTMERLESLKNDSNFEKFFKEKITINNFTYKSLNEYMNILPELVEEKLLTFTDKSFPIIHGDLCFSNILVEGSYGFLRVIDPRGNFGQFDIYGDQRYDLAKLLHSLEGKYDYIIEDMFVIDINGTSIDFRLSNRTDSILEIFMRVFKEKLINYKAIQLIESLLFLSMIPLHNDSLKRQYAMLATGIILLEKSIK